MDSNFEVKSPHTWITLISFFICILFVILAPKIPIFLPSKKFLFFISNFFNKKSKTEDSSSIEEKKHEIKESETSKEIKIEAEIELPTLNIISAPLATLTDPEIELDTTKLIVDPNVENKEEDIILQVSSPDLSEKSSNEILNEENVTKEEKNSKYFFKYEVPLDMGIIPIFILLFLFLTQTLNVELFLNGIIGDEFIKPYTIIILFMSLAN